MTAVGKPKEQRIAELEAELAALRGGSTEGDAQPDYLRAHSLQHTQANLRGVLDSATSGIVACEAMRDDAGRITDFRFTLANPMSEKMLGHTTEEMVGNTLLTLFPGNIESGLFDRYVGVTESGVPMEVETHYHDERLAFWLHVSAVKVGDGVAITFTDISARKRAEAEAVERSRQLARQKAFAEGIIANVPAGICYLDRDLIYRVANPVYAEFLQMKREDILERYLFDVVPGGEDTILPIFRAALDRGEPHFVSALPFEYITPEGTKRQTYWDAAYLPMVQAGSDEVEGVLLLANEVTDRLERDRERDRHQRERIETLEEADQLKDQFLGILSHELRTPINAITGFGSVLDDGVAGELTALQRAYVGKILTSADTLLALIDDLLVVSRVQAGQFSINTQSAAFEDVVRASFELQAPAAARKGLTLTQALPADLPLLPLDSQRLVQVLNNLLGNAIKFTPAGGAVTLEARIDGGELVCEVRDTGPGIAAADHDRLFRRFGQLDSSDTRSVGGTGLGLFIVKAIVEAHGGRVGMASEPGAGSVFWWRLPLAGAGVSGVRRETEAE